jgi:hypothetical protein
MGGSICMQIHSMKRMEAKEIETAADLKPSTILVDASVNMYHSTPMITPICGGMMTPICGCMTPLPICGCAT